MEILATYETFQLHLSAYFRGTTLNMQESTLRYRSARTWLFCLYFSGTMFESQQPFKNTAAVERLTSPAKFANALNYSRSLRLTLDKYMSKNYLLLVFAQSNISHLYLMSLVVELPRITPHGYLSLKTLRLFEKKIFSYYLKLVSY